MKRITPIFQSFFKVFLIFLICFIWLRYFVSSLVTTIIISALLTFVIDIISRIIFSKHRAKQELKNKEKQEAIDMFFAMAMKKAQLDFFVKIFKNKPSFATKKQYLCYEEEGNTIALFPAFSFEEVKVDTIAKAIVQTKSQKAQKLIIVGGAFERECFSFIKNFEQEILLYDKFDTYTKIYKKHQTYPETIKKIEEKKKFSSKELLAYSFDRKRVKGYFLSALSLLFCSLFVRQTIYYSIFSSLLLVFGLISLSSPFSRFLHQDS